MAPQEQWEPQWLGYSTRTSAVWLKLKGPSAGSGATSHLLVSKTNQQNSVIVPTLSFGLERGIVLVGNIRKTFLILQNLLCH